MTLKIIWRRTAKCELELIPIAVRARKEDLWNPKAKQQPNQNPCVVLEHIAHDQPYQQEAIYKHVVHNY